MVGPGGWANSQSDFTIDSKPGVGCFWIDLGRSSAIATKNDTIPSEIPYETCKYQKRGIHVSESHGANRVGFFAPKSLLLAVCHQSHIPKSFVENILRPESLPRFEYALERSTIPGIEPIAINLGFRWGTGHPNYMVAFGRYDLTTSTLAVCIASKGVLDYTKPGCEMADFTFSSVRGLTQRFGATLYEHPLNLVGILLECCERFVDTQSQYYGVEALSVRRGQKGVLTPASAKWIDEWGVKPRMLGRKIDELFSLYDDVIWGMKNCEELVEIESAYMDLNVINMQFVYQYNHSTHEDAESTRTISYLTLIFLPSTFVCAVFSTTLFNFQNWKSTNNKDGVVSRGWWIFVLTCVILCFGTIALWNGLKLPGKFQFRRSLQRDPEMGIRKHKAAQSNG
ncbi:hypothetical protein P154DRAFT_582647 [Amniculicola lignicola CBS 123094]|uniref:Uncharacterized protein n=1 Tax=Amniculicola lignicola CBS 123094 TaxID=1392246 RepID=A0A6A5W7I1_9PLEO|nr:hypothetical protein P154DRAFT_582647 [Amniculicola lignicola CBS 123094]